MQWDRTSNAGFTTGRPWLPLEEEFSARNVADQTSDPQSMLSFNRALVALRNEHAGLNSGDQRIIAARDNVLLFERSDANGRFLVALNFSHSSQQTPELGGYEMILSTHMDHLVADPVVLRADEGVVLKPR
jgi:glycosidase